jgi:hypothetical protein
MPKIDLTDLDTQIAPMEAISQILKDFHGGFTSSIETLEIINAVTYEWNH